MLCVVGCWLFVVCSLLAVRYWLCVARCSLCVACHDLSVVCCLLFVTLLFCWFVGLLVLCFSFVVGSSLVVRGSLLIVVVCARCVLFDVCFCGLVVARCCLLVVVVLCWLSFDIRCMCFVV